MKPPPSTPTKLSTKDPQTIEKTPSRNEPFDPQKIYYPIVINSNCFGKYSLETPKGTNSNNTPRNNSRKDKQHHGHDGTGNNTAINTTGVCQGISSRLQILEKYPPMTAQMALESFYNHSVPHYESYDNEDSSSSPSSSKIHMMAFGGRNSSSSTSSSSSNRQYPYVVEHQLNDMNNHLDEITHGKSNGHEDTELHYYGSTDTIYLALQQYDDPMTSFHLMISNHQKHENVIESKDNINPLILYALAPLNNYGITSRKISSTIQSGGNSSITQGVSSKSLKIGMLEATIMNMYEDESYSDDENDTVSTKEQYNKKVKNKLDGKAKHDHDSNTLSPLHNTNNDDEKGKNHIPLSIKEIGESYFNTLLYAGTKLEKSMKNNANYIKRELEDDFINRTIRGGEKVIGSFEKTLGRIQKLVVDVVKGWSDNDDE